MFVLSILTNQENNMKVTNEHYKMLKEAICADMDVKGITLDKLNLYYKQLKANPNVKDATRRLRWDMLWSIDNVVCKPLMDTLYTYYNDDHIDTALKQIVKELKLLDGE